jgi:hypothetical protein
VTPYTSSSCMDYDRHSQSVIIAELIPSRLITVPLR